MVGWGILLLVLGIGSLLLPMLNMQFRLMELVDPYQPWAGIVVAVIGAVLVFLGQTRRQPAVEVTSTPAQQAPPPAQPAQPAPPPSQTAPPPDPEEPRRQP
jgi:hypothetical protein